MPSSELQRVKPHGSNSLTKLKGTSQLKYDDDKVLGQRSGSGYRRLKKIRPWHRKIIQLYLEGLPIAAIARAVCRQPAYVGQVLSDPLVEKILNRAYAHQEKDFANMAGLAQDALRAGLLADSHDTALKAAKLYYDEQGRREAMQGVQSAEDVISALFSRIGGSRQTNVQINVGQTPPGGQKHVE